MNIDIFICMIEFSWIGMIHLFLRCLRFLLIVCIFFEFAIVLPANLALLLCNNVVLSLSVMLYYFSYNLNAWRWVFFNHPYFCSIFLPWIHVRILITPQFSRKRLYLTDITLFLELFCWLWVCTSCTLLPWFTSVPFSNILSLFQLISRFSFSLKISRSK